MRRIPPASPSPASRMSMRGLSREASSSAHFPKSVLHSQHPPSRTSESHGLLTNLLILVPLYRSEVPDRTRRLHCRDFRSAVLACRAGIFQNRAEHFPALAVEPHHLQLLVDPVIVRRRVSTHSGQRKIRLEVLDVGG